MWLKKAVSGNKETPLEECDEGRGERAIEESGGSVNDEDEPVNNP
jgi:hypothetical protein